MVKELLSFSDCGQYFVHCGSDGLLRVWDTFSGVLKQEYTPNLHLKTPCTCLTWISLSENNVFQNQKRKRKLKERSAKLVVLGSKEGALSLYSITEGDIISTLRDCNSSSVQGLSWSKEAGLFSVDGSHVLQWDLENKSVRSKWKCKEIVSCVAVSPSGDLCVTGNINISLWEVKTQQCLKKFIGHSSELCNLIFINDQYFLSCGVNDRHITAWTTIGEDDSFVRRFSLGDNMKGEMSILLENKTSLHMVAVTSSGTLLYFTQQLNGKASKSVKPIQKVELVHIESSSEANSTKSLPVICGRLKSSNIISVAYGFYPNFGFEAVSISTERDNHTVCVLNPEVKCKKAVSNNCIEDKEMSDAVEYSSTLTSTAGTKRKLGSNSEVTMEERLGNLCIDMKDVTGMASTPAQNPHNLSHLLIQGLDSKDKAILESVLMRRDPKIIHETVSRLPVQALVPLVQELNNMMRRRTLYTIVATEWLRTILREHASQLLADPSVQTYLTSVQSLVEARLCLLGPLGSLSGRLTHIMQQLDSDSQGWRNLADSVEPVVLYQERDSSDEGGSIIDGDYESEDKWDELSDEQPDSEPSS